MNRWQRGFVPHRQMMGMFFVTIVGILAAIAVPAYNEHVIREKMFEVLDAGNQMAQQLDAHLLKHGSLPDNLAAAGISASSSLVSAIQLAGSPERLIITTRFSPLDGKSLVLALEKRPPNAIWHCSSKDIPEKHLPRSCRG